MADGEQEMFDGEFEEEIPVDGGADGGAGGPEGGEDLEAMKRKLKEMEEEAARLRALQGAGGSGDVSMAAGGDQGGKEEVDSRSIYVGNVDYSVTPEELQQHFNSCGTVNRVTILTDKFGNPKGYAYVEFLEVDAVGNALLLDNTELRGRNLKVVQKRTNVPGLKQRGRGRGRGRGGHVGGFGMPYGAMMVPPFMPMMPYPVPYGGGGGRGRGGFAPRGGGGGRGRGRGFAPY